jgi:hypothetical protein
LYGFTQSFGRHHSQAGPLQIIFGHRDDKMCGMPIFAFKLDLLKFNPFQQSVGSGKSGLAPNDCFACIGLDDVGK